MSDLYDRIVNDDLLVRRLNVVACNVVDEMSVAKRDDNFEQLDLFTDYTQKKIEQEEEQSRQERERRLQQATLSIKKRFGKNAILKGMNLEEGATAKDRNAQIGGHKA